jgi:mannose-6-phosphate isomerase
MNPKMYKILPIYEQRLWGGRDLIERFHFQTELENIAEAYCVIAIPNHLDCEVEGTNEKLSSFYHTHHHLFGCDKEEMPVRLVLGSSNAALSVQLHPEDEYGLSHSGMRGKPEGALFYMGRGEGRMILGHHAKTKEEFIRLSQEAQWDKLLRYIYPKKDDFVHIPAGVLHAFQAKGIVVAFSTNGDVTYRLYDYDRIDPLTNQLRELHVREVFDNIVVPCDTIDVVHYDQKLINGCTLSYFHDEPGVYTSGRIQVSQEGTFSLDEFFFILCLEGEGSINGQPIIPGETYFVPCNSGEINLLGTLDLVYLSYKNKGNA